MNNSFIFTPPATAAGIEGRGSRVEGKSPMHTRFAEGSTMPFSNVLDRAVQTTPKKVAEKSKQESSASGRPARSVEAPVESKSSAPQRTNRRKEKRDDETIQPAVCSGMPALALRPVDVPVQSATDSVAETTSCADNCAAATLAVEVPKTNSSSGAATETASVAVSTEKSSEVNPELSTLLDQEDRSTEKSLAVDVKPMPQSANKEAPTPTPELPLVAEQIPATSIEELSPAEVSTVVSQPRQTDVEMPQIPAATAREVALGVSRNESALVSQAEVSPTTTRADPAAIESAIVNPITAEEARRSARADRSISAETREKSRGTAAAKLAMSMNNEANREEIAGLTQQNLPSGGVSQLATGINLPSESQRIASKEIIGVDLLSAAARLTTGPARTDVSLNTELLDVRETSPAARIGEVISREVRMFKRGGDDMVEVILTPDAKTQISLKLQWRDGQVEVQARCDMGDHRFLNTQWSQLQATFAAHGVRLSHLSERAHTGFTEFFGNSGFSQQQGGERQSAPQQSAIDLMKPSVPTPKTGAARSVVRSSNRLESWA